MNNVIEERCGKCKDALVCWYDYKIGIWSAKDLKCDDIRALLEYKIKGE